MQMRFPLEEEKPSPSQRLAPLDTASEGLLAQYRGVRLTRGASAQTVRREVSQIRSLARAVGTSSGPVTLASLLTDLVQTTAVLIEPPTPVSRATVRSRLNALQRFVAIIAPDLSLDAGQILAKIDASLPSAPVSGWHRRGIIVGGAVQRRSPQFPTLGPADLERIVETARADGTFVTTRNRAILSLFCFSGLRPEDIQALTWQALDTQYVPGGLIGMTAQVARGNRRLKLLLSDEAAGALRDFAFVLGGVISDLTGPIFCRTRQATRALSAGAVRAIVADACRSAGLPPVTASDLRSACALWLKQHGLSDHEIATVLGLAAVRSVDRLMERHQRLSAQRAVALALKSTE